MKESKTVEIDELDRKILNKLLDEGRLSFRKIAEAVGSTPATVINRVERLEEKGVVNGYSANIDYRKLGYDGIAAIEVIVRGENPVALEDSISNHNNVMSVYSITGDTDILILAKFEDRHDLTSFVKQELLSKESVEKTITHMAFDIHKENINPKL